MVYKLTCAAVASAVVFVLAGCSVSEAGVPRPADTLVTSTDESESESPTSKAEVSPLDGIEPCGLLSASDVAELGVRPGKDSDVLGNPGCDWSNDFGFSIGFQPELSFQDFDLLGSTSTPVSVGSREAYQVENIGGGAGACNVFLVTSESSFVQVTASGFAGLDTAKACGLAVQVAAMIDPRLP